MTSKETFIVERATTREMNAKDRTFRQAAESFGDDTIKMINGEFPEKTIRLYARIACRFAARSLGTVGEVS